jgi:IPT/TIG domain
MRSSARARRLFVAGVALLLVGWSVPKEAAAAEAVHPLPASDYSVESVCGAPLLGHASCLAERLVPQTAAARARSRPVGMSVARSQAGAGPAAGAYGLRPVDLHEAYTLPTQAPTPQTIAIVDAYDDPTAESDLGVYDEAFGLPECTSANHCFRKINEYGQSSPLPNVDSGWAGEISLDVQTARALCQSCQILLVEAASNSDYDLAVAEDRAVLEGADEISNSYGGTGGGESGAYDHPGVAITASTGDWGYDNWLQPSYGEGANYPAGYSSVVAVGGTYLGLSGGERISETAWSEGGSGCASVAAPSWQASLPNWPQVGCGTDRSEADVSADGDPYSGVAIYDSTGYGGWVTFGGTSLSSPIIASIFALAGGADGVDYPARTLYSHSTDGGIYDVLAGSNGGSGGAKCSGAPICLAGQGYDGPTGIGSPAGTSAFEVGSAVARPVVTGVSPPRGPRGGGGTVTISGSNLAGALAVHFGDADADIIEDEEGSITVEAPSVYEPEVVDVTVTAANGVRSATSAADQYEYIVPQPVVTSIEPDEGPTGGGTLVTIHGSNLAEAEEVKFGSSYGYLENVTEDEITVATEEHPPGQVDVVVVGPEGVSSATSPADAFEFVTPTHLLSVVINGSGHGRVSVSPLGLECESSCSGIGDEGTELVLTPSPGPGSTFVGWSGGFCTGNGICRLPLFADRTVYASFEPTPGGTFTTTSTSHVTTTTASGSSSSQPEGTGSAQSYGQCMQTAQAAYGSAVRAATHKTGRARKRALTRARKLRKHQRELCGAA